MNWIEIIRAALVIGLSLFAVMTLAVMLKVIFTLAWDIVVNDNW